MLYQEISGAGVSVYPALSRLLEIYHAEHGAHAADAVREAFESAVDRRLLRSCFCACPSCLNDRGGQETPGQGWMLLSRPLLAAWVDDARASRTLELGGTDETPGLSARVRSLLEQGASAIYLRAPGGALGELAVVIPVHRQHD